MRVRALVAAAAVALIVPAVPAFATETPSTTTEPSETTTVEPSQPETEPATDPATETRPETVSGPAAGAEGAAEEPTAAVVTTVVITVPATTPAGGATFPVTYDVENVEALGANPVANWTITGSNGTSPSGPQSAPITLDADGVATVQATMPTATDTYRLTGFVEGEGGATDSVTVDLGSVDATKPVVTLSRSLTTFYPYKDGYRDTVTAKFTVNETVGFTAKVVTGGGTLVRTLGSSSSFSGTTSYAWNGYNNAGSRVSGTYYIRIETKDKVGNATNAQISVAASAKKLTWKTYSRTVTAADALDYKYVGSCSTLKAPARSDWSESRGLRSNTRCKASATSSKATVYTENVKCLPKSVDGNYRNLSLKHYGGRPKGYTKNVYMVSTVLRPSDWAARQKHQFGNSVKWKTMASVASPNSLIQSRTSTQYCPAVWWTAGLNSSSRYDVWKYSVGIQYRVLA
ncbi:hypothetical protein [Nocardioides sp. NPDC047086]|uniref:hypothetical protein n=1 Tax=Nocardioides sp. NPDC047086 TaxID=3154810 RepID=UPI0034032517